MNFGTGYIPDHDHHVAEDHRIRLFGGAQSSGKGHDLTANLDRVRDQVVSSSCVGHGLAEAIGVRSRILGYRGEFPAPLAVYTGGRSRLTPPPAELRDVGTQPRAAMDACADPVMSCLIEESKYPLDFDRLNSRLPLDVFSGADGRAVKWHRISADGQARGELIRNAIDAEMPVPFGAEIYQSFEDYTGGLYVPAGDPKGGHMQCILAYTSEGVIVLNSWGTNWGSGGFSTWGWDTIGGDDVMDMYVIESGMAV